MNLTFYISKISDKDKGLPDIDIDFDVDKFDMLDLESIALNMLVSRLTNDSELILLSEEVNYPPGAEPPIEITERFIARPFPVLPATSELTGFEPGVLYDLRDGVQRL